MYINEEYKRRMQVTVTVVLVYLHAMAQKIDIVSKGRKRKLEELEVDEVESLDEPLSTACVHGVISTLSPIKKGCKSNYFNGSVSDGKSNIRLVGFNPSQQIRMKNLMKNKQAVKIDDCEVRHARRGQSMEILLKGSTKISMSPRKFEYSNPRRDYTSE